MGNQVGRDEISKKIGAVGFGTFVGKDEADEWASCEDELQFIGVLRSWRAYSCSLCFCDRCEIASGRFGIGRDIR